MAAATSSTSTPPPASSPSAAQLTAEVDGALATLAARAVPYVQVLGHEPGPDYRRALSGALPEAAILVWPDTGHFPHLAHPERFAELLARTGRWTVAGHPAS